LTNSFSVSIFVTPNIGMEKDSKVDDKLSTEEKFKEAARKVFMKKGYAATKTRDIAQEAGLNLALLNYYFRSKEKLFEIIMLEKVQQLFAFISPVFNNPATSLNEKIDLIANHYINLLLKNPDLPLFVLSEIRNHPERFGKSVRLNTFIMKSYFVKQLAEKNKDVNPAQLFLTFLGMLVFPFIVKPVFMATDTVDEKVFDELMEERKVLTSKWMKMILK